jgi:hypothetical protein
MASYPLRYSDFTHAGRKDTLESRCLNGQHGDQCFRSRFSFSSR